MLKKAIKNIKELQYVEEYPKFNLGSCLIVVLCSFLIVIATFTKIELPILNLTGLSDFFKGEQGSKLIAYFSYIPQIPAVLFASALLGPRLGLLAIFIYFVAGLIGIPVFAMGGGIGYITHVGFGYIIGYFVGAVITSRLLKERPTHYQCVKATMAGVMTIHIIGILYLILLMFFDGEQLFVMIGWIWLLSGMQLLYDFLIGFIVVSLARPIRTLLWVVMG